MEQWNNETIRIGMAKTKRKILLHICCASCLAYSFKILQAENFKIIGFFYNPNIHGQAEYKRRLRDVSTLATQLGIELIIPAYSIQDFFQPLFPYQDKKSLKYISDPTRLHRKRCTLCYDLRLRATASETKKKRLKYFSTTLLVSPFRNHTEIVEQATDLAVIMKLHFFYRDFRKGYWQGRNFSRANNFYLPSYCGCTDSIEEKILE